MDEISLRRAAERDLEALRAELAELVAARHDAQVRLEEEIAQRDRVLSVPPTESPFLETNAPGRLSDYSVQ